MKVEINLDDSCQEPKVVIFTDRMTEEIDQLVKQLIPMKTIAGFQQEKLKLLDPEEIVRVYAQNQKVYAQTEGETYLVKIRLYEMEERLSGKQFVRISNSEIVNLKKVVNMDLSLSGTICIKLCNNVVTYVSRRFVSKIKQVLEI